MPDVFTMLHNDHRHVEDLLTRLSETNEGAERDAVIEDLTSALMVHMRFEEQLLYPLLGQLDAEAAEEAEIEHRLAREALSKLSELAAAPGFGAAVEMLSGGIKHHVREEERELFPQLKQAYDGETIGTLGSALKQMKADAGLPAFDQRTATKSELLELARDAGIDGRSQMTKEQLRDALASR
jgi:hemerythrin superfamily protein